MKRTPYTYVKMCGKCRGVNPKGTVIKTKESKEWNYDSPCGVCGNNHHNSIIKCEILERDGDDLQVRVIGVAKEW